MLRISVQADKQIVNQLDKVYGDQIPNDIQILYDKGHGAVNQLDQSLPDDVEKAKQDFLLAMNSFMQISRIISQSSEKVVVVTVSDTSNRNLSDELDRLVKYVKSLETISKKYDIIDDDEDYKYLVKMPMDSVSEESVEKIIKALTETQEKYDKLFATSIQQLWLNDLDHFEGEYALYVDERKRLNDSDSDSKVTKKIKKKT